MIDIDELADQVIYEMTLVLSTSTHVCSFELTYPVERSLTAIERTSLANLISNCLGRMSRGSFFDSVRVREVFVPPDTPGSRIIIKVAHTGNY